MAFIFCTLFSQNDSVFLFPSQNHKEDNEMTDITKNIMVTDFRRQDGRLNSCSRLDFLMQRLRSISPLLDQTRKIQIYVMTSDGSEVQQECGKLQDARDLIKCYDATHSMTLSVNRRRNAVIIRLGQKLYNLDT